MLIQDGLLPKGLEQLYPGSGNTFTVTFQKAGTYGYICILHPWMTGQVVEVEVAHTKRQATDFKTNGISCTVVT